MKTKRFIAWLLAVLMIAPAAVSCSSGTENALGETEQAAPDTPAPDAAAEAAEPEANENLDVNGYLKDDLPELDFGGEDIGVLFWSVMAALGVVLPPSSCRS